MRVTDRWPHLPRIMTVREESGAFLGFVVMSNNDKAGRMFSTMRAALKYAETIQVKQSEDNNDG